MSCQGSGKQINMMVPFLNSIPTKQHQNLNLLTVDPVAISSTDFFYSFCYKNVNVLYKVNAEFSANVHIVL